MDVQADYFVRHITLARALSLPVVCHIRDAHEQAIDILSSTAAKRGIIHCFTGGPHEAERYLELGFHLSFSGIVTFRGKKADPLREAAKLVPNERILVETDCPYLAPSPTEEKPTNQLT